VEGSNASRFVLRNKNCNRYFESSTAREEQTFRQLGELEFFLGRKI
jgi:hypothetical protein